MENIRHHPLINVTPEEIKKIRQTFNLDDVHRIRESLEAIEEWCKKQDHLVTAFQYLDRGMLERLLFLSRGSVEGTKNKIDKLFTMRKMIPELNMNKSIEEFENLSDFVQYIKNIYAASYCFWSCTLFGFYRLQMLECAHGVYYDLLFSFNLLLCLFCIYVPLPNLCPSDQSRVMVTRPVGGIADDFNLLSYLRYSFLIGEYRFCYDYCISERYIVDLQFVTLNFLTKFNPVLLKKAEVMCTEVYGTKIKGIHIINAPSFVDKLVFLIKQGLKEKVASRLHVHNSYEDLHKEIPKEILPKEYDGDGPSCEKLADQWKDCLKSKEARKITEDCNKLVADESKRSEMKFNEDYLGMPGSFRKLNVD